MTIFVARLYKLVTQFIMTKKIAFIAFIALASALTGHIQAQDDTLYRRSTDEVVITATRAQTNRNNVPMTMSVISRAEIEESSESALLPVLSERVPGMFITQRGVTGFGVSSGGTGGITLRGVGGSPTTGVLVLIDGHPQYMGIMGHHLPDAYVASDVEKVEVIRGPASILYGSNAMGGVVNIITRKQDEEGWSANGHIMYGSYNTQKYQASAGLKQGKINAYLSLNHDRTDGHRDNSDFSITNGYAKLGYQLSNRFQVWGDVSLASFEAQNPGSTARPMIDNIADIMRGVASVAIENDYGKTNGTFKFFYNFGDHKINDGYSDGGSPRDFYFRSKDHNYGITWYQVFRPFQGNMITAGIDFKNFGGRAWNEIMDKSRPDEEQVDATSNETAGYVTVQQTITDKLTLNAGLRYENSKSFGGEFVPQAGLAYHPWQNGTIKASVAKGYRSPTIRELYYLASWAAANPDLKPERMMNYELSVGQTFLDGRLTAELTGFISKGSNMIQQTGSYPNIKNENIGDFKNSGIELAVYWNVLKNLRLQGNYSYLHLDKIILNAPEQQAFISASYRLNKWSLSASYQHIGKLYTVLDPVVTEDYGLVDAKISFRPTKRLDIFVKGENLADASYETVYQYPMPGFTVFGGINISIK